MIESGRRLRIVLSWIAAVSALVCVLALLCFAPGPARIIWYRAANTNPRVSVPRLSWWPGPLVYVLCPDGNWRALGPRGFGNGVARQYLEITMEFAAPASAVRAEEFLQKNQIQVDRWIAGLDSSPMRQEPDIKVESIEYGGAGDERWLRICFREFRFSTHGYQTYLLFKASRMACMEDMSLRTVTSSSRLIREALSVEGWTVEILWW